MKPPTTPAASTLLPHGVMPLYQIRTPFPHVESWLEAISRGELSAQQLGAASAAPGVGSKPPVELPAHSPTTPMSFPEDLIDQLRSSWPDPIDCEAVRQKERALIATRLTQAGWGAHATFAGCSLSAWVAAGCPMPSSVKPSREAFEAIPGLRMMPIPAGAFLMGSPPEEPRRDADEGPQHRVTLPEFFMGQTPITQAQWREVAGWPIVDRGLDSWELNPDPAHFKGDDRPVERVSWYDAMEFCRRLSQRTGRIYTLPSEAQWEYACRAGTTTPFHFGATISTELANYDSKQTTTVASFPANAWGLHDMHGSVWEWCLDDWHPSYEGAPENGSAWMGENSLGKFCAAALGSPCAIGAARPSASGTPQTKATAVGVSASVASDRKVLRGGSWFALPRSCRSAFRLRLHPDYRGDIWGFRVCCLPQD